MNIQRIEAKLDALIDALGFDVMFGEVYEEQIANYPSTYPFNEAVRIHAGKNVNFVDNVIIVSELRQEVKLVKKGE